MNKNKQKEIIFLEPFPEIMMYKMARLLRKKGYKTISIRILENKDSDDFYEDGFDKIISFNLHFLKLRIKNIPAITLLLLKKTKDFFNILKQISKFKPYVVISRAGPSWPSAITRILFPKISLIYFPYDIRSAGCKTEIVRKKKGHS